MSPRQILVSLGDRSYPIYAGNGMAEEFGRACGDRNIPKRLVVVTDRNVARLYLKEFQRSLRQSGYDASSIVLPPGERQKSLLTASKLYTLLLRQKVGRSSALIALGGGVIGDLTGFVAATYQRGISLIHVPTTLLAQVDSSVGGKTGVNHPLGKNLIGAFYHPSFVWADAAYLETLPQREVVCGLGEIIKYGVILDEGLFAYLEDHLDGILGLDPAVLAHVQEICCMHKAEIVSRDERESGIRAILNYGHTVGHGLEAAGGYGTLSHGEAVLLGMVSESFLARERGFLSAEAHERIVGLIRRVPLRYRRAGLRRPEILKAMGRDKKSRDGRMRFALPVRIGEARVVGDIPGELVAQSLQYAFEQKFVQGGGGRFTS